MNEDINGYSICFHSTELATVTKRSSSTTLDDGIPVVPVSRVATNETKKQEETDEHKAGILTTDEDERRGSGHAVAVGEWNSLPVLVKRLREALKLSLAGGWQRDDKPMATSSLAEQEVNTEVNDRLHTRNSMEQTMLGDYDDLESKKDELKFLEDLLLLDIQTALSRLREMLECMDIATIAKYSGVSDPTSKLHLLQLVSSLLSRLQVPQKEAMVAGENRLIDVATAQNGASASRKRRFVRHTIGVSAEEIAYARKQLEESSMDLMRLNKVFVQHQQESLPISVPCNMPNNESNDMESSEKHIEEICDKYTKDAINQRQSLRDKNKDCHGDIGAYQLIAVRTDESNMLRARRQCGNMDEEAVIERTNEEKSQVTKLAAMLRKRAELVSVNRCNVNNNNNNNNNNNKFIAKKSKIKRANTIDIPSYLKLHASSFGCDNSGCIQLRRPINVGDKVVSNATNYAVPSFHPRTENDKKFLALINRNNEMQATFNSVPAFKSFGYTKETDMSSLTNENWNSRFSNIKTAFDKQSSINDDKFSPKPHPTKRFSDLSQTSTQLTDKRNSNNELLLTNTNMSKPDVGFRHAPSSLFRKIEKSKDPISPPNYQWFKNNVPLSGNTLREKARITFHQDCNIQSQSTSKHKIDGNEISQKLSFPRPPWIERDRNDGKSNEMITENGRLDYRLFCKQFAPFIGKNTVEEHKKSRKIEEKGNEHSIQRVIFLPSDKKLAMANGNIFFETLPKKGPRVQLHHRTNELSCEVEEPIRDKFNFHSEKDIFEPIRNCRYNEQEISENVVVDSTLSGSSSIAIQTSENNDNQLEDVRMFRVIPKVPKSPSSVCNNSSIQTYNQSEQPLTNYVESKKEWTAPRYECNNTNPTLNSSFHFAEDSKSLRILKHNWNYHTVATNALPKKENLMSENTRNLIEEESFVCMPNPVENIPYRDISDCHSPEQCKQVFQADNSQYENCFSTKLAIDNQPQIYQNSPDMKLNRDFFENEISSASRVYREIDKKDISCTNDGGLIEEQNIQNQDISADAGVVTRYTCAIATVASADTPDIRSKGMEPEFRSSFFSSPSHFLSHTRKSSNEIITNEEEIRRHNMLQQSMIRRLQNDRTMLNNQYTPSVSKQLSNFNQLSKFQSSNSPLVTASLSVPLSVANRVTILREQYEQPDSQSSSVKKEFLPLLNGVSDTINSNDKYLVSCSDKSAKSIVLSKSESWHQLTLTNKNHSPPRPSQGSLPPTSSHLLKLPKPKSPSFFRTKKQYEASLSSDDMKRMEDKIRKYFNNSNDNVDAKDSKGKCFSSHNMEPKGLIGLSRSRTVSRISDEKLKILIPATPQISATNFNSADVDKVFDDIFEEAIRDDDHCF